MTTKQHDFFTSMPHANLVELMIAKYAEVERLKARVAELEAVAKSFVTFELPDTMIRMKFEHLLKGGK